MINTNSYRSKVLPKMINYPPEMYNEILKDHNFRYGKFNSIPYPKLTDYKEVN